jgi:hypothetical protein
VPIYAVSYQNGELRFVGTWLGERIGERFQLAETHLPNIIRRGRCILGESD